MAQLPIITSNLAELCSKWKSLIDPVIANTIVQGRQLQNIKLISGSNAVNHGLGRELTGWMIVRRRQWKTGGVATAYDIVDTQDSNSMSDLTLKLVCSQGTAANPVLVDLWVY